MQSNWDVLARDSRRAAELLKEAGCIRSCLSRAYYSAYAVVTWRLLLDGHTVSSGDYPNPGHEQLLQLARNNLPKVLRYEVERCLKRLRAFRLAADYDESGNWSEQDAVIALQLLNKINRLVTGDRERGP